MAADRLRATRAIVLAALVAMAACPMTGRAGTAAAAAPSFDKPSAATKRDAPTHEWIDGGTRRALTLEAGVRADFTPALAGKAVALRAAQGPLADVSGALQSPVLRDESGRARALPGGVLVVLAAALDDASVQAVLARYGVAAARRVDGLTWLVDSPAGLASLELANRLARSGEFASAQPNWWVQRVRK